jgi:hypothetical protein
MSLHIVDDEILAPVLSFDFLTSSLYSSLTCNYKELNLSRREGVQCWLACLCLAAWAPPSVYRAV